MKLQKGRKIPIFKNCRKGLYKGNFPRRNGGVRIGLESLPYPQLPPDVAAINLSAKISKRRQ